MKTFCWKRLLCILTVFVTGSCVQTSVSLDYVPELASIKKGPAIFQSAEFVDLRQPVPPLVYKPTQRRGGLLGVEWDALAPRFLGTVGADLIDGQTFADHVFLHESANVIVTRTVAAALSARGMVASGAPKRFVVGEILEFSVDTVKNPHAVASLRVTVKDVSGRVLHSKVYTADRQSLDHYPQSGDVVASLRMLAGHALQDAIDAALDDPAMRRAAR